VVDLTSKTSIHYQEEAKRTEIKDQIEKCRISSPQDGLVVYNQPEQSRFGTGSRQSIIAQGESVYEGQKMMRIPDLTRMQVSVKIHEALITKVRGDEYIPTRFTDRLRAALLLTPDPLGQLLGQVAFAEKEEQLREQYRSLENQLKRDENGKALRGQKARIRI